MIGTCRPLGTGLYTVDGAVTISLSMKQTWKFKYVRENNEEGFLGFGFYDRRKSLFHKSDMQLWAV